MKRTRQEKIRLGVFFVLVCFFFGVVVARLIHLQVIQSPRYSEIVKRQSSGTVPIPAPRGIIYDRNGTVVANNVTKFSLYAYPGSTAELNRVAAYIEHLFDLKAGTARKRFGLAVKRFRWVKRMLDDELAERIANNAPAGLHLRKETQRDYPYGLIGKQVIGFADIDNHGKSGVELSYDAVLTGKEGFADIRRDGLRNTYRVQEQALVKPQPGRSLVLTIDWNLQEIVEEELRRSVIEHNAKSGQAVFVDCTNGEVLAIAHYDPSEKDPSRPVKLRAVSDQFEPGSILKAFTGVGVIEEGLISYDDTIYCEMGVWKYGRRPLHDDKKHGWLNFRGIIELSSNIGIAKLGIMLGGERLVDVLRRFGLGEKTDIGLPGEASGRIAQPNRWTDRTTAALAMGHAVTVNAVQMANGFAAIANGGEIYQPRVILGQVDHEGQFTFVDEKSALRRVIDKVCADTLASILRGVVERGTATEVNSPVVSIAGKTGTAQIPEPGGGAYSWNKYMASFAGFFPCEKPKVAGIVIIEEPQPIHYGGLTAGPAFRRVAERYTILHPDAFTAPQRVLSQTSTKFENTCAVPELVGHRLEQALATVEERGLDLRSDGDEGTVLWQYPAPGRLAFKGDEILVSVKDAEHARMVDLRGLSIREASAFLGRIGLEFLIVGNGQVVAQSIKPGQTINPGEQCRLECRPASGGDYKAQRADKTGKAGSDKRES